MADDMSIKAELRSAFRDFRVDGVPASGPQEPEKVEIRNALVRLADRVEGVAGSVTNGVRGYALTTDLPTLAASDDGALAKVEETGLVYRWDGAGEEWVEFDDPTLAAAATAHVAANVATAKEAVATQAAAQAMISSGVISGAYASEFSDDQYFQVAATSQDGVVLHGIRFEGWVQSMTSRPFTDDEFETGLIDEAGVIVAGRRWGETAWTNGPFYILPGRAKGAVAVVEGSAPNRSAALVTEVAYAPLSYGGDVVHAALDGPYALYRELRAGQVVAQKQDLRAKTSLSTSVKAIRHCILYGQSLSNGSGSVPALTTTAADPGWAVMYPKGVRALGHAQSGGTIADELTNESLSEWIDARELEAGGETPACGLSVHRVHEASATGALLSAHGVGGAAYSAIKKGTQPYKNLMVSVVRANLVCQLLGLQYKPEIHFIHGEADRAMSKAQYRACLEELQQDLQTDIRAVTRVTTEVRLFVSQMHCWTSYGAATSDVPAAVAEAARENPGKIVMVGPRYPFETVDGVHLKNTASYALGDMHGRAAARFESSEPPAFRVVSASRSGSIITLTCEVPVGPIVLDTMNVTDPASSGGPKYGLVYSMTGGSGTITVTGASVSGTTITVTLSGDPGTPTTESLRIAMNGTVGADGGPTTGPRTCFRDSATGNDAHGIPRTNWLCADNIPIT